MVLRLILETAPGRVDTGATYPECSRDNPSGCNPQQFAQIADAIAYAASHGETPYLVTSEEEAWGLVEGSVIPREQNILTVPENPADMFLNPVVLGIGALALFWLFRQSR